MSKLIKIITVSICLTFSAYANANTIDNLERERAKVLNLVLDKNISINDRKKNLEKLKMRLLDSLEKGKTFSITWFEKIGLTTDNLMSTRVTRK